MMDDFKEREDVDPFFYDPQAEVEWLVEQWEDLVEDEKWENEK